MHLSIFVVGLNLRVKLQDTIILNQKDVRAGSVWGHAGSDSSHLEDYRNPDSTMRSAQEIYDIWAEEGIDPSNNLAFYCGTGWRAAEVLFYADVMGLENISLYDGGWNEWSMDPSNPVETGEPAN